MNPYANPAPFPERCCCCLCCCGCHDLLQAAWKAYSDCEKKESNAKLYGPLSKGSKACESMQSKGAC
jgi:hypothetical protein